MIRKLGVFAAVLTCATVTACAADDPDQVVSPDKGIPAGQFDQVTTDKEAMRRDISFLSNVDDELAHGQPSEDRAQHLRNHRQALIHDACKRHDQIPDHLEDVNLQQWGNTNCGGPR